ncbi:MAG: hypothetical protein GX594_00290 [Pirellulaceae bacterium]|nr:hypothetical protein [Pirellulaceae bacterium]
MKRLTRVAVWLVSGIAMGIVAFLGGGLAAASPFKQADVALPMAAGEEGLVSLPGDPPQIPHRAAGFVYDFKLDEEQFFIHVPRGYDGKKPFGLVVFINSGDEMDVPRDWKPMLAKRKLIYIAPQKIGNNYYTCRRVGLAVEAACKMTELYNIDLRRVYVSGHSGGARSACTTAFFHPDLIAGAFPICGAEFPGRVPRVKAPRENAYGVFEGDPRLLEKAKANVGFALITGSKDFCHGYIQDLYNGGFVPQKYRAKLFDVAGMGHEIARAQSVDAAVKWLDKGNDESKENAGKKQDRESLPMP